MNFRALATSTAVCLVMLTDSVAVSGQPPSQDWPRFLGNSFDGVAEGGNLNWDEKPDLLWSLPVGDGYGMGSVARGKYFQLDASSDDGGQLTERLRCIDLASGKTLWTQSQGVEYRDKYGFEDGPRGSPTIVDDEIYTLGVAGRLTRRKFDDGELVWSVDTNANYGVVQNFFGVGCSPLVLDDRLIVMIGGSPADSPTRLDRVVPNGSAVVAFDRETGKELWKCGDDLASYSSPRTMQVGNETLVLVFARDGLLAIDPEKGVVRWRFDHRSAMLESVNAIVPVVDDDLVLISECYEVGSVLLRAKADSCEVLWQDPPRNRRVQAMRAHWSTPILIDGFLYGCSGRNEPDSDFRCIDFKTGGVKWVDPRRIRSSVTRVGDHLLVLEERGLLQVIRPNPDRLDVVAQWDLSVADRDRPDLRAPCWSAPIVVGNRVLLRGTSKVLCLEFAAAR